MVIAARSGPEAWILAGGAALLLLVDALRNTFLRPVLQLDRDGLRLVDGMRRVSLDWWQVDAVRSVQLGHLFRVNALEIDADEQVFVVSRYRLGRPPAEVAAEVNAARAGWPAR